MKFARCKTLVFCTLVSWLLAVPGFLARAQEAAGESVALSGSLNELELDEDLDPAARLDAETNLLMEALAQGAALTPETWALVESVLNQWEDSPRIDEARTAYTSLLSEVAARREAVDEPFAFEQSLRSYLQKALTLTRSSNEEGTLLFYLADSWLRSRPDNPAALRRAESLLLQSVLALGNVQPRDAAHFRLGQLYNSWGSGDPTAPSEGGEVSYLTRAAENFRAVVNFPEARPVFASQAQEALGKLLEPELVFEIDNRFLPQNEVRFRLRTRNIQSLQIEVRGLPPGSLPEALSLEQMEAALLAAGPDPATILVDKVITVRGQHPHDWREREVRLDETFVAGWYGVILSAGTVSASDLLLVTPLELAALPRAGGDLLIWVADAETGQPSAGASFSVLDAQGSSLVGGTVDEKGMALLEAADHSGWTEIHVRSGQAPAHLRRNDLPQSETDIPWMAANPSALLAGETLHWAVLSDELSDASSREFVLPDGSILASAASREGRGWTAGELVIPQDLAQTGPVYARLGGDRFLLVAHVIRNTSPPLLIHFSGEQIDPNLDLFLSSAPIGIQISRAFGSTMDLPEFIRLVARVVDRNPVIRDGKEPLRDSGRVVHEVILPVEEIGQGGTFVELTSLPDRDGILPLRIEVLPLGSNEPISAEFLGVTPYRSVVELTAGERILRAGQPARIHFRRSGHVTTGARTVPGSLVVFRETWENRYIHRKRGTSLSEAEYLALPDRSLLGAAKTDYRLAEQGFVREEVSRIPIEASRDPGSVSIELERPGYYHIEFDGGKVDSRATYPEGPLEVWVVPDSTNLRGFRSESPRLVSEKLPDGGTEILLLLDRTGISVLLDLEFSDGLTQARVEDPEESALFLVAGGPGQPDLTALRAFVVGDRQTNLLSDVYQDPPEFRWELQSDNLFGLNPGVEFDWEIETEGTAPDSPVLWTFFEDRENTLTTGRLRWQENLQQLDAHHEETGAAFLNRWLPLSHPFIDERQDRKQSAAAFAGPLIDPVNFATLYPEVQPQRGFRKVVSPFRPVTGGDGSSPMGISGNFPNAAGRWYLTLLSATGHHLLKTQSWMISTELPVRSFIEGLSVLRVGDKALLPLVVENTTGEAVGLDFGTRSGESVVLQELPEPSMLLPPFQGEKLFLEVTAIMPGNSSVDVTLKSADTQSEALHQLSVLDTDGHTAFSFFTATPADEVFEQSVAVDGWLAGEVLVCSGLGALLPEIWPHLRREEAGPEPLMAALGDWALRQVSIHHGMPPPEAPGDPGTRLEEALEQFQTDAGGWTWLSSGEADPWLSSFVMWTLEIFSRGDGSLMEDYRRRGRSYLESILIDESVGSGERLFALRALAVPAFHSSSMRPSRIQARSFLDFLHQRAELSTTEIAFLLQVARAFAFNQEVQLLVAELDQRMDNMDHQSSSFWMESLLYLSLTDFADSLSKRRTLLSRSLEALARRGATRSWEQVGGFLNLLAVYYWTGDFNADGSVTARLGSAEPVRLSLDPDLDAESIARHVLEPADFDNGGLEVRLDMASALSPVLVAGFGLTESPPSSIALASAKILFYREYFEETLLSGTRRKVDLLDENLEGVETGDLIRVVVQLDNPVDRSYAEFHFPVPAGCSLAGTDVEHSWEMSPDGSPAGSTLLKAVRNPANDLEVRVRMGPLPAGRHQLAIPFEVTWAGSFRWPRFELFIPRTGDLFHLNEARLLRVQPYAR